MTAGRTNHTAFAAPALVPIDMVLHCPKCGLQHIDAPDFEDDPSMLAVGISRKAYDGWTNPPHRSHLCAGCGHVWRPADVPTNGVAAVKTKGKHDSPVPPVARLPYPPELIEIVGQVLDAGHLNTEDLARLRDAWERAQP